MYPASAQSPVPPAAPALSNAAQAVPPLTLQRAIEMAMASNAELSAARRELQAADGPVMQGGTRPNPELSFLLEDTQRATRTTTLQINQPIELGGKRAARISAAERGRDIAAAELAAKRADLRATVVSTFYDVLLAQEHVKLAGDSTELARRAADAAGKRVQAGKISPVEETRARVAEATARLEAAQAASELRLSRQRLAATWGDASPRFDRVASDSALAPVPTFNAVSARLATSPSLRRAQIEVQRRSALSDLERAKRTPDLTVSLGVKRDEQLGRSQAVIGLSIPLPLFDRNQGNLLEALRREDKSRDELAAADIQLKSAVAQAWGRLDTADAEVRTIRDQVLPGAQSAYDAATQGFELGKFNLSDVLDAQRTLFQGKAQYLRARGEAHRAAADIDRLLGDGENLVAR
ncbi:MAG: TolC family protein [Burkholderiales bacterium]